jgi:conjugal transfer pilin signal peptidase TrbI
MVSDPAMAVQAARPPIRLRTKLGIILAAAACFCGYTGLKDWHDHHAFVINASESLPNWAFLVNLGQFPERGEYVLFDPGHDPLTVRHFGVIPRPSPRSPMAFPAM